jgi:hypothetical protein
MCGTNFYSYRRIGRNNDETRKGVGKLGETPYEPLKEEQEGVSKIVMEKQVTTLNNTFISFFRMNVPNFDTPSSLIMLGGCQIYKCRSAQLQELQKLQPRAACAVTRITIHMAIKAIVCNVTSSCGSRLEKLVVTLQLTLLQVAVTLFYSDGKILFYFLLRNFKSVQLP